MDQDFLRLTNGSHPKPAQASPRDALLLQNPSATTGDTQDLYRNSAEIFNQIKLIAILGKDQTGPHLRAPNSGLAPG